MVYLLRKYELGNSYGNAVSQAVSVMFLKPAASTPDICRTFGISQILPTTHVPAIIDSGCASRQLKGVGVGGGAIEGQLRVKPILFWGGHSWT